MSVAADYRQIAGGQETLVSETAFADETAGRRALWWAGVMGLDPLHPVSDPRFAAQNAAMACAAHVLGADITRGWRKSASPVAKDFYEWLCGHRGDDADAKLRRLALRLACDIPGLPAGDVLDGAIALHAAVR